MDDLENIDLENAVTVNPQEFIDQLHDGLPCDSVQAFALDPQSFDPADNTIKVRYTNNAKVLRYSWLRDEFFYLKLSSKPGDVDLGRLNNGANVVDSHDSYSIKTIMGAIVPGSATENEATIKFSSREELKPFIQDIKDGIIRFVSPGFNINETKDITKEGDKYRTLLVTKWEPYEISFCAVPADPEAQAFALKQQVAKQKEHFGSKAEKKRSKQIMGDENEKLSNASAEPAKTVELNAVKAEAKAQAKAEEKERSSAIFAIAAKAGLGDDFAKKMISDDKSIAEAQAAAFDLLADKTKSQEVKGNNFQVGETEVDKHREGMTLAIEARAGNAPYVKNNKFNNMTLSEMAKFAAEQAGADVSNMSKSKIAEFALHSTSDFPNILANVANKTIRKAYEESNLREYTKFCNKATLPDFKPVSRVQVSEIPTPTKITEGGEFKQTTLSDGKETYQLATYGEIISITRQTIINDDLSVLSRIPKLMGVSAARLEGDVIYAILTGTYTMADSVALFHADHGNLTDALLLSTHASLHYYKDFVKLFRTQKGPKGVANLNLYPKYLIVGPEQEEAGWKLLQPVANVVTGEANPYARSAELIVEPRISTSYFYGAADPNLIDTIEYGYLEGEEGPQITTRNGFEVDGVEIKMRLDFGAAALDHRGLAKSTNNDS